MAYLLRATQPLRQPTVLTASQHEHLTDVQREQWQRIVAYLCKLNKTRKRPNRR